MAWVDEAATTLRGAGYRPGAAGQLVLEHLAAQNCCVGAKEIHDDLRRHGRTVGLASVYRMLDALSEQSLVQRVDVGDGIVRYEPARRSDHHHHLVCARCHGVAELEGCEVDEWLGQAAREHGFTPTGHTLEVTGLCAACQAA